MRTGIGSHGSFESAFADGLRRVLIYRLVWARSLPGATRFRPWLRAATAAFVWVVVLPFGVWLSTSVFPGSSPSRTSLLTLSVICGLNLISLTWGSFSWALLVRRAGWVDQMLDDGLRLQLVRQVRRNTAIPLGGWIVVAVVLFLVVEVPAVVDGHWAVPSLPILFGAFQLVIVVGTTLQLSWAFPGMFTVIFRARDRPGALRLLRLAPSATPGLRFLSDGLAFGSSFLLACLVIAVAIGFLVRFTDLSGTGIAAGLPALIGLIVVLLVRFTVVPVTQLHWLLLGAKIQGLKELDNVLRESSKRRLWGRGAAALATEQMSVLLGSENLPFKSGFVLQFIGVAGGAVVAYVLQALFQAA